jgi:hypothetical protein
MNSSLIGKIEKAKRYAQEPGRVRFQRFEVSFRGAHDLHRVAFDHGRWECNCHFFALYGTCSHTMAMERILGEMMPSDAEEPSVGTGEEARVP